METLKAYAKAQGAVAVQKVNGPRGAFIAMSKELDKAVRFSKEDKTQFTIPVGKKSQTGKLEDFNVLIASDTNQAIATVNLYEVAETVEL